MNLPEFLHQDPDGFIHLAGHRVGLEHVIHYYNEGYSPEMLACEYPTLTLATLHKVIAFYLENRQEVDTYLQRCKDDEARQRAEAHSGPSVAELRDRLETMRGSGTA